MKQDTKLENAYKAAEEKRRRAAITRDKDTIPMDFGAESKEEAVVVNPDPSSSVVNQKPDNMSDKHEWRDLGKDEVICKGDEVFSLGMWIPVSPNLVIPINDKRKPEVRIRTRRPLPKQERIPPRLDAEIEVVDDLSTYSVTEARHATADAIRYLRDEIQKLKEAKP
jgi:hypothetical protein